MTSDVPSRALSRPRWLALRPGEEAGKEIPDQANRRAETPECKTVKGLIPERGGQAYRPARVNGIKGRADAHY